MNLYREWPSPAAFGLDGAKFPGWRLGQPEAINAAVDAKTRFTALVLPTGFGKSLTYMGLQAVAVENRMTVLTATRALQEQLDRDFGDRDAFGTVKGQRNYVCTALEPGGELASQFGYPHTTYADTAPCHHGVDCSLKSAGCHYYDTLRKAQGSDILVTNYAWWLTLRNQPQIQIRPDILVLDEAHDAPDALADALGATVTVEAIARAFNNEKLPAAGSLTPEAWMTWAQAHKDKLASRLEGTLPRTRDAVMQIRRGQALLRELQRVAGMRPELMVCRDEPGGTGVRFDVIWAAPFAEDWLFRGVKQVVMTSATMTLHTAELLGVIEKELTFYEGGSGFPVKRRPVYVAPAKAHFFDTKGVRVDHRMTFAMRKSLVEHIDEIIDGRLDRKGIIHTVSYERRDLLLAHSRHVNRMMAHDKRNTQEVIAQFKAAPPGTILISPSVTTGYDFPYQDCEYQILMKIPFPDSRDPIVAARSLADTQYPMHVAMQSLVQTCGRPMRAADDQAETFLVDAHARWFLAQHKKLAPKWFMAAVQWVEAGSVPTPPRPLGRHTR